MVVLPGRGLARTVESMDDDTDLTRQHPPYELTQRIKAQALALGFDLIGIAPAQESPELAFFESWLEAGYAGEMHYLRRSRERRRDLQQVLPGAQSVVVCGLNYDTDVPYSTTQAAPNRGW